VTVHPTATPLVAGVALLERALGYTLDSLLLVTPAHLAMPTPCREWDLAALLDHMNDSLLALHEATAGHRVELVPVCARHRHEVPAVADLRARGCRLLEEWHAAEGDDVAVTVGGRAVPASLVAATGSLEVAVHAWDVAAAVGAARPIPAALAEPLLDLAPLLVSAADRGSRFAPAVTAGPDATPSERLLAVLGRAAG
jgi:uncharacterized protein (TIGR03086 family)